MMLECYYISWRLNANNEGVPQSLSDPSSNICFNSGNKKDR